MINKIKLSFEKLVKQKTIDLRNNIHLCGDDLDVLMKVIKQSTVLEELDLECNNLTLADGKLANAIATNTTLKVLGLYKNCINPQGTKHLADALKKNNTTLEVLSLGGNNIGDEGAKYIANMLAVLIKHCN